MGKDQLIFNNPINFGVIDLSTSQVNKDLPFTSVAGVFIGAPKVDIYDGEIVIKTYLLGSGLALTGTNTIGNSKTLTVTFQGTDFSTKKNKTLIGKCTFFVAGDIEVVFNLKIV